MELGIGDRIPITSAFSPMNDEQFVSALRAAQDAASQTDWQQVQEGVGRLADEQILRLWPVDRQAPTGDLLAQLRSLAMQGIAQAMEEFPLERFEGRRADRVRLMFKMYAIMRMTENLAPVISRETGERQRALPEVGGIQTRLVL